jgi:predicted phosphate transport protein (TIGR00153 family)
LSKRLIQWFSPKRADDIYKMVENHIELTRKTAENLQKMAAAADRGDAENRSSSYDNLDKAEKEADQVRAEIGDAVSKSGMFPEERIDIIDILHSSDLIADYSKEAGRILNVIKLDKAPTEMRGLILGMTESNVESVKVLEQCIKLLPKDIKKAVKLAATVEEYEEKVDRLYASARLHLADLDFSGWSTGSLILLTEFLKSLEAASDHCEITYWEIRAIALRE